jgi:hypothetical protein
MLESVAEELVDCRSNSVVFVGTEPRSHMSDAVHQHITSSIINKRDVNQSKREFSRLLALEGINAKTIKAHIGEASLFTIIEEGNCNMGESTFIVVNELPVLVDSTGKKVITQNQLAALLPTFLKNCSNKDDATDAVFNEVIA